MRLRTACCFELRDGADIASANLPTFHLPTRDELVGTTGADGTWSGDLPMLIRHLAVADDGEKSSTEKMRVTEVTFAA